LDVEGRPRSSNPLAAYIHTGKDKSGMNRAVLKIPHWRRQEMALEAQNHAEDGDRANVRKPRELSPLPPTTAWGAAPSSSSLSSSTPSLHLDVSDRGTADGGFPADFTSVALEGDDARGKADGKPNADIAVIPGDEDDDSSEFDDFSDGGDPVNIIDVVNGGGGVGCNANNTDNEVSEMYMTDRLPPAIGHCRAVYDYEANIYDELSIRAGDVIAVHEKQADGWWLGRLGSRVGIFPATYVREEIHEKDECDEDATTVEQ